MSSEFKCKVCPESDPNKFYGSSTGGLQAKCMACYRRAQLENYYSKKRRQFAAVGAEYIPGAGQRFKNVAQTSTGVVTA